MTKRSKRHKEHGSRTSRDSEGFMTEMVTCGGGAGVPTTVYLFLDLVLVAGMSA